MTDRVSFSRKAFAEGVDGVLSLAYLRPSLRAAAASVRRAVLRLSGKP